MSNSSDNKSPAAVIGIGNYLRGDDGAGIHAVEKLRKIHAQDTIDIIDGGSSGPRLRFYCEGRTHIVFIDAGDFGGASGEWVRFTPDDAVSKKKISSLSMHGFDLLAFIREHISGASVSVYAIQPECFEPGTVLSDPVSAGLEDMLDALEEELKGFA